MSNSFIAWSQGKPTLADGTPFSETVKEPRSPEEELRPNASRAVSTMLIPWHLRQSAFQNVLLEWGFNGNIGGNPYISRNLPRPYLGLTTTVGGKMPFLYVSEVLRCVGRGLPDPTLNPVIANTGGLSNQDLTKTGPPSWFLAACTLIHATRDYELVSDAAMPATTEGAKTYIADEATQKRYTTPYPMPQGSAIPLPINTFKFYDGSTTPVSGQPSKVVPQSRLRIRHWYVPVGSVGIRIWNPTAANFPQEDMLGCVNSLAFPPGAANQYQPGQLLYESYNVTPQKDFFGRRILTMDYDFAVFGTGLGNDNGPTAHPVGHNQILKSDGKYYQATVGGGDNYVTQADGVSIYNWRNLGMLFRPPQ